MKTALFISGEKLRNTARESISVSLFPMFLKLASRRCLVIGAGKIAEQKIDGLLRAGADILVVAPRATRRIATLHRGGVIFWRKRKFSPRDLGGVSLVVAATSSPEVNDRVFRESHHRGILCNSVDDPPRCDFYYPAVVVRGPFQIAISTTGASPALAQRLRRELDRLFTAEFGEWVATLGKTREKLLAQVLSPARRRKLLRRLATPAQFREFLKQQRAS